MIITLQILSIGYILGNCIALLLENRAMKEELGCLK